MQRLTQQKNILFRTKTIHWKENGEEIVHECFLSSGKSKGLLNIDWTGIGIARSQSKI